jgi:hypothetical protein
VAVLVLELPLDADDLGGRALHVAGALVLQPEGGELAGQSVEPAHRLLGPLPDVGDLQADLADALLEAQDDPFHIGDLATQLVVDIRHDTDYLSRDDRAVLEDRPEFSAGIDLDEVVRAGAHEHASLVERFRHGVGRGVVLHDGLQQVEPVVDVGRAEMAEREHAERHVTELALVFGPDPFGQLGPHAGVEARVEPVHRLEEPGVPRLAEALPEARRRPVLRGRPGIQIGLDPATACEFHISPGRGRASDGDFRRFLRG